MCSGVIFLGTCHRELGESSYFQCDKTSVVPVQAQKTYMYLERVCSGVVFFGDILPACHVEKVKTALDSDFWQILCSYSHECPLPLDVLHVCDQKEWPEESDGSLQGDGDGRMLSCLGCPCLGVFTAWSS